MRTAIVMLAAATACTFAGTERGFAQAAAQTALDCTMEQSFLRPQTLHCGGGLTIVAETGARFTLLDRNRDNRVDGVNLQSRAILVTAPKKKSGPQFEVVTPQAIAAVRGTTWAVDAEFSKTSVFVENGRVSVRRRAATGRVSLGPGEGVDVGQDNAPLTVKRWPAPRVAALMARLGR